MGGVGRPEKEIPEDQLVEMLQDGWSRKDTAAELGITTPTLRRRIANLQKKEGQILQYRALQSLELTEIEAEIVNRNPTPEEYSKAEKAADEEIKLEEEDILEEREFLSSPFQQREPLSNRDAGKPGDNASVGNVLFPL